MTPEQTQLATMVAIGLIVLALLIWVFLRANRKATIVADDTAGHDVLEEGAAPAARNQALIDAPQAAEKDVPVASLQSTEKAETDPVQSAAVTPPPAPTSSEQSAGDDLRQIKGLGPKLVALLAEQGITRFDQIAAWSDADIAEIDAKLGRFAGRITRDQWVEQAKLLATGNEGGFAEKFGQNQ